MRTEACVRGAAWLACALAATAAAGASAGHPRRGPRPAAMRVVAPGGPRMDEADATTEKTPVVVDAKARVYVDGQLASLRSNVTGHTSAVVLAGDRVMLPVRFFNEVLDVPLSLRLQPWGLFELGSVAFKVGEKVGYAAAPNVGGDSPEAVRLPVAPRMEGGALYMPVASWLPRYNIVWDGREHTLRITTAAPAPSAGPVPSATRADEEWGAPVQRMAVSISTEQSSYRVGETITLLAKLRNVGATPRRLVRTSVTGELDTGVALPSGKPAPLTAYANELKWQLDFGPLNILEFLDPGVTDTAAIPVNRLFDMTLAGRYKISVGLRIPDVRDPSRWLTVESNPLSVTVAAGEAETPLWLPEQAGSTAPPGPARPGTGGATTSGEWGAPVHGVALSIRLEKGSYRAGEPVILTVARRNAGTAPLQFGRDWPTEAFGIEVILPSGKPASPTLYAQDLHWRFQQEHGAVLGPPLRPDETERVTLPLSRLFDMTLPGRYSITASFRVTDPAAPGTVLTARSNRLALTIADEDASLPRWLDREFGPPPARTGQEGLRLAHPTEEHAP